MSDTAVKSARRVIELLEFFAEHRQPATLMEVARAIGAPPSSTAGTSQRCNTWPILDYDRKRRTFLPTLRATLLGIW